MLDNDMPLAGQQHTLKTSIHCTGIGLHSGRKVSLTLEPAPAGTGIVFVRSDLPAGRNVVPARWDAVVDTRLCTVIGNEAGATVSTIEHLMAALAGCGVDNAVVTVDAPEVPIMDGSSAPFVFLIECAGMAAQDEPRQVIEVLKRVEVRDGDRIASLAPSRDFRLSFEIDFASGAVRRQAWELRLRDGAFKSELARARTFGFLHEVEHLRSIGLAQGGSLDNAIVISGDRVLNEGGLRFRDEFVRHKILDAVGDLYCAGAPIRGHYHGHKAGHGITNLLLRALFADESAWRWADAVPAAPALTGGPVWDERLVAASA